MNDTQTNSPEPPFTWANEQMTKASVPEAVQKVVVDLLDQFWAYALFKSTDDNEGNQILEVFNQLAQGHGLVKDEPDAVWIPGKPGDLVIRDVVRVRSNAYSGHAGVLHNGQEGVIVAIRNGDIHVRYDDGSFVRHSPHSLDKRIR